MNTNRYNNFDWEVYVTANRDLWEKSINTYHRAFNHWMLPRTKENRQINFPDFDWVYYIDNLKKAEIDTTNIRKRNCLLLIRLIF